MRRQVFRSCHCYSYWCVHKSPFPVSHKFDQFSVRLFVVLIKQIISFNLNCLEWKTLGKKTASIFFIVACCISPEIQYWIGKVPNSRFWNWISNFCPFKKKIGLFFLCVCFWNFFDHQQFPNSSYFCVENVWLSSAVAHVFLCVKIKIKLFMLQRFTFYFFNNNHR